MKISNESMSQIKSGFDRLVSRYSNMEGEVVTDFHLQPLFTSGEVVIFDDDDEELDRISVPEFQGLNSKTALKEAETILRRCLESQRKSFEQLPVMKPFSFVMVDLEKETLSDLLLIDDDLVIASEGLLKDLDEDLNDFLNHLLAD